MNNITINKLMILPFLILCIALFYLGIIKGFLLFLPFLIGYGVSRIVSPIADWIVKHSKIPKGAVVAVTMALVIGICSYLVYLAGLGAVIGIKEFASDLPQYVDAVTGYAEALWERLKIWVVLLPQESSLSVNQALDGIVQQLSTGLSSFATKGISALTSIPSLLIAVIVTLVSSYFYTKDYELIRNTFGPFLKKHLGTNPFFLNFKKDILSVLWGYLKAQLILMSVTTVIVSIGLLIFRIENAPLLGLLAGAVDALPLLGPAAFFMPWILVMVAIGNTQLALKLFGLYLLTTITRQLLEPKVLSAHIGVHPILTLMGLYLGIKFLGVPGLILGPFTMVTLVASYKRYIKHQTLEEPAIMHLQKNKVK